MHNLYSINDVGQKLGIAISTIRKYEQDYNLSIMRNESNNRVYTDEDIEILKKIVQLKTEGANIHLIRKILTNDGVVTQVPEVIEEDNLHTESMQAFKNELLKQISEIVAEREKTMKQEFEILLDEKLQQQEQRIREQLQAENQKLIGYIESKRDERKTIWNRIFGR